MQIWWITQTARAELHKGEVSEAKAFPYKFDRHEWLRVHLQRTIFLELLLQKQRTSFLIKMKGLKTKVQLVKRWDAGMLPLIHTLFQYFEQEPPYCKIIFSILFRVEEYIKAGCDKNIVDPNPNSIYTNQAATTLAFVLNKVKQSSLQMAGLLT